MIHQTTPTTDPSFPVHAPESPSVVEDAPLAICLFGPFEVRIHGGPLPRLRSRRGQWLLALLALRSGKSVDRGWLAGTLWPDSTQENAQRSLRQTLTDLRHALGDQAACLTAPTSRTLAFDGVRASVDVLAFDAAIRRGDPLSLAQAVVLHTRPLLEDCHEEWVPAEREPRELACLEALEVLAADALARQEAAHAVAWLRRAVAADPYRESAQRGLMTALAQDGQWGEIIHVYRDLRLRLQEEMRIEPAEETHVLYERLRAESRQRTSLPVPAEARPAAPGGPAPPRPRQHLPRPLTTLVGRERERGDVGARLFQSRLVTLCGPGGVGKTRLAIEAAQEWAEDRPEGVWFVDLAPLSDPALVGEVVASVLCVREEAGVAVQDRLTAALHDQRLLLVLDNCEHLLDACARLADALLRGCAGLRLLATSRQALGLTGESVLPVLPLPLPDCDWADPEGVAASPAVRLFVERAASVRPGFALSPDNAQAVTQICCRLDGIPLALELAAARVKVLSVEQIASRLDHRFLLLTQGSRAALPRQQTLRALLDWSYDLLSPEEQVLLGRLSVFAGGWTWDAAQAVCSDEGRDVLDALSGLVDKSLVQVGVEDGPDRRYRMLDTVREYGRQRLGERGETEQMAHRHREWCRALAAAAESGLRGPDQAQWLARLAREHDNLRVALEDYRAQGALRQGADGSDPGLRFANTLRQFWEMHGHCREGRQWLQFLLAQNTGTTLERARALNNQGLLAMGEADMAAAQSLYEQGLALFRQAGDRRGIADALNNLGIVAWWRDDYAVARTLYEESLAVDRELDDVYSIAGALCNLGLVAQCQGDYTQARDFLEGSLALRREVGDQRGIANALLNLGVVSYDDGDDPAAAACCEQSLALFRTLGQKDGTAISLTYLGRVASRRGDGESARALHQDALGLAEEIGDKRRIADTLGYLADVSLAEDDPARARALYREQLLLRKELGERRMLAASFEGMARWAAQSQPGKAVRLCAAADVLRAGTGAVLPRAEMEDRRQAIERLRGALGPSAFAAAWNEGQSLPLEQAVALALEPDAEPRSYGTGTAGPT